jgi:hypothetical protein
MPDTRDTTDSGDGDLAVLALLYAGDELADEDRSAFEQRLGHDQAARDALAQAVQVTLAPMTPESPPRPDPAYRQHVRRRLRPSWGRRLLGPVCWIGVGAAAALLIAFSFGRREVVVVREKTVVLQPRAAEEPETPAVREIAQVWAELHNHDHLTRAVASEQRRKTRAEDRRLTRTEERRIRKPAHPGHPGHPGSKQ